MILYNRSSAVNGNGCIFGVPGSGKSFSAKREIVNVLLHTDDEVFVIDPENEYGPLAGLLLVQEFILIQWIWDLITQQKVMTQLQ